MDLTIDNEISKSKEIDDFTKELQNALTKDNSRISSLYNEFDFIYFDYDKNQKSYFMDSYSEGNISRCNLTKKNLEGVHFEKGTLLFYNKNE